MKIRFAVIGILCMLLMIPVYANNPLRKAPYPQQENIIYLNPAPLLVPLSMKHADYLQFNLSQDKNFKGDNDILSKLKQEPDDNFIGNDFKAGELVY